MRIRFILCAGGFLAAASAGSSQVVIGDVRVEALSPTLLRVEPKGPQGFEDRTTFMVTSRDFAGIPISKQSAAAEGTLLSTKYYDVLLRNASQPSTASCSNPRTDIDLVGPVRTPKHQGQYSVASRQDCCSMCEADDDCRTFIFDPNGKQCWIIASFSDMGPQTMGAREVGCSSRGCGIPTRGATCGVVQSNTDASSPARSNKYPNGAHASSADECCQLCQFDNSCVAYVFQPSNGNCWPLGSNSGTTGASDRVFAAVSRPRAGASFKVTSTSGQVLYDTATDKDLPSLLHWPAPLTQPSYALTDRPRFFVPEWGTAPIPEGAKVEPALTETNGYDFRNNVDGDTYVFLLGSDLDGWSSSRAEFLKLAGSCPLLPDFAYGTWFTYWQSYTESEAKDDISHWENLKLPIDVWALDMNWRNTANHQDWYYKYPNTNLFPNFTEWFQYLKEHKLRTYFNDHPYPVQDRHAGGGQTSPEEVAFRWNGLSEWMDRGLTYWWFDHNWGFSIPPPFVDTGGKTDGVWQTLDNAAWGSHVYYNAVRYFDKTVRDKRGDDFYGGRPITLTKFGKPDWRPGMDPKGHAESPAQHRYPVWWTGDGVNLQASVESMVDAGLYDFKPFVHSDCGGDYKGTAGDLLRWTAHCAYGNILRFHGNDHRSWKYGDATVNTVRSYLNARYKLLPSIIAAGQKATETGFPLVARGDFFWPEHKESSTNQQYVFLEDILVAPIFDSKNNQSSRSVWIPPGEWEDAWDGSIVTGPKTMTTSQPYERQPMWHKHSGGFIVLADEPGTRVDDQDWSSLTLEAFPSSDAQQSKRSVFERKSESRTDIQLTSDGQGGVQVEIGNAPVDREWTVRMHLRKGDKAVAMSLDGEQISPDSLHLQPGSSGDYFPLAGAGTQPPSKAGPIVELKVPKGQKPRMLTMQIQSEKAVTFV